MKKTISVFLLIIAICFSQLTAMAVDTTERARVLYDLGLLKGTTSYFSAEGLELNRNATRAEACITIVRMLGKEAKANYQMNSHPFNDVPSWASNGIGWLYENYLVNGVGDVYFGAQDIATVQQFSAMLLRVLGYSETEWDFTYDTAVQKGLECGILTPAMVNRYELSRSDMVDMCFYALSAPIKYSSRTLINKLCDERAVDKGVAENLGVLKAPSISDAFPSVPENLGPINVVKMNNGYRVNLSSPIEEFGLRVFVRENGKTVMEIPYSGNVYAQKGRISYPGGSAAGYVNEIYVYGLDQSKTYSFIVLKTTSHSEQYLTVGKSAPAIS